MISDSSSQRNLNFTEAVLNQKGIVSFKNQQLKALIDGFLEDQNFLLALPTRSGKTLLAAIKSEEIIKRID